MYCEKCGNEIREGVAFCGNCGSALAQPAVASPKPVGKKLDIKKLALPLVAVCIVIAVVIAFMPSKGSAEESYETAIRRSLDVEIGKISSSQVKALMPEECWDWLEEEKGTSFNAFYADYKSYVEEDVLGDLESGYGKNIQVTFEVLQETAYTEEDLGYIAMGLSHYNIAEKDVKAAYKLRVATKISGSKDEYSAEGNIYVVKIRDKWYVCEIRLRWDETTVEFYAT